MVVTKRKLTIAYGDRHVGILKLAKLPPSAKLKDNPEIGAWTLETSLWCPTIRDASIAVAHSTIDSVLTEYCMTCKFGAFREISDRENLCANCEFDYNSILEPTNETL